MAAPQDPQARRLSSLHELPQAIEPARDLWPAIEARLKDLHAGELPVTDARAARVGSGARLRWLAAAAMVASVAVGVWIGRSVLPGAGGQSTGVPSNLTAQTGTLDPAAPTALDTAYETDPRYQHQRAALLGSLQAQLAKLPPASRAKVMASLQTIWHAKQDLEQALGKDPGNALLEELLVNTYQDEMRVLTDVHEASESGRGI
jgi:hypothetical protein